MQASVFHRCRLQTAQVALPVQQRKVVPRVVLVRADKQAALNDLKQSKSGLSARLSGVEAEAKADIKAAAAAPPAETEAGLEEIDFTNYYDKVQNSETPIVVVDFFTEWCGPCKLMYPRLVAMQEEMDQVTFYKFNCNKKNKALGMELDVKVAPTFFVYKHGEKVGSMTGAKEKELRAILEENM